MIMKRWDSQVILTNMEKKGETKNKKYIVASLVEKFR